MSTPRAILFRGKTLKDGTHPIMLRVYFGKAYRLSLGLSCRANEWNSKSGRLSKRVSNHEIKNALIRQKQVLAEKIIGEMALEDKPFSWDEFKNRFGRKGETATVHEFLDEYIHELKQKKKIGNMRKYKQLKGMLLNFNGRIDLKFSELDYKFCVKFETYMHTRDVKKGTIHFYFRTLRATINEAIRRGYMRKDDYPFSTQFNRSGFSISHLKGDYNPKPLSMDEIDQIKKFDPTDYPELEQSYDVFMFLFYARGLNFVDLIKLTKENIVGNRLNYIRTKTGKRYSIKISEPMRRIIKKYRTKDYLFPYLVGAPKDLEKLYNIHTYKLKHLNDDLKQISRILQTNIEITSYVARYSYTNVLVQNDVSAPKIKDALGQSSLDVTQHYIAKFKNEVIDELDELL
ncbi:MAG: site-specific integrase [Bacteroidota bacterium]